MPTWSSPGDHLGTDTVGRVGRRAHGGTAVHGNLRAHEPPRRSPRTASRGSSSAARPRDVRRRPPAAGAASRRVCAEPVRPRTVSSRSTRPRRGRCPASTSSSPPPTSMAWSASCRAPDPKGCRHRRSGRSRLTGCGSSATPWRSSSRRPRALAEDAGELVDVTSSRCPRSLTWTPRSHPARRAVFDEVGHNLMFQGHWTYGDPDDAFADAARTGRCANRHSNAVRTRRSKDVPAASTTTRHRRPHVPRSRTRTRTRLPAACRRSPRIPRPLHTCAAATSAARSGRRRTSAARTSRSAPPAAARPAGEVDRGPRREPAGGGPARDERLDVEAAVDADGTILGARASTWSSTRAPTS